jgi:hypothetical protein
MNTQDFIQLVKRTLGEDYYKSGAVLYSSFATLKKGNVYILGFNPGKGKEDGESAMTIEESLERSKDSSYNQYTIPWYDDKKRLHPLQRNVQAIIREINLVPEEVCASNLIFLRSKNDRGVDYNQLAPKYWPVHQAILHTVQPELIIAFGNGPISSYQFILGKIEGEATMIEDVPDSGHGNYKIRAFSGKLDGRYVKVIGLPHLSRYHLHTNNPEKVKVVSWLKSQMSYS